MKKGPSKSVMNESMMNEMKIISRLTSASASERFTFNDGIEKISRNRVNKKN